MYRVVNRTYLERIERKGKERNIVVVTAMSDTSNENEFACSTLL